MLTSTRAFPADCSRVQMYSPPPTTPKQSLRDHRQHIPVLATSGPEANAFKPRHLCHSHQGWLQSFYHACLPFDTEPISSYTVRCTHPPPGSVYITADTCRSQTNSLNHHTLFYSTRTPMCSPLGSQMHRHSSPSQST